LLSEARRRFGDVSDLMLALRELRRRRRIEGEPTDALDEAIETLTRQADPKLMKAGINAALKAKVFGKQMQLEPERLRQLYRQFLMFEGTYLMIYESWIEEYGVKRRKRILEYVQTALTYDMQSLDPSCSGAGEFGPLLRMLVRASALNCANDLFVSHLLQSRLFPDEDVAQALGVPMLLDALQRRKAAAELLAGAMAPVLMPLSPRQRSEFVQCVLRAFAAVPTALFEEPQQRPALLAVIKGMADVLFDEERRSRGLNGQLAPGGDAQTAQGDVMGGDR
jgi:type III secretion protein W